MYGNKMYHIFHNYTNDNKCEFSLKPPQNEISSGHPFSHTLIYNDYSNTEFSTFNFGIDRTPLGGYSLQNRQTNVLIINFVVSGKGTFNGIPFEKGICYYSKPTQIHTMISDPNSPWYSIWFAINGTLGRQLCDELDQQSENQMLSFYNIQELMQLAVFFMYEYQHVQDPANFTKGMIHLFKNFLFNSSYALQKNDERNSSTSDDRKRVIKKSLSYIEQHINTVTVASLAKQVNLETKYFSKIFEQSTGVHPSEYIQKVKMNIATHYLINSILSIEEITTILGYGHRNTLTTAFKKTYGMSPYEYRQTHTHKKK